MKCKAISSIYSTFTGSVFENERRFDLVVRLANQNRKKIEDVRNLYYFDLTMTTEAKLKTSAMP
jgi:Cu/Ag efflux pump CusA